MNKLYRNNDWLIIEEGFHPAKNRESESIFSVGNGYMGQRANFEERYSGDSLQGSYIAGIYYPDKTRVGWWKNGYPDYFAKVLNSPNWIGIDISIDGKPLDLAVAKPDSFRRVLNMKEGYLERSFLIKLKDKGSLEFRFRRFLSMSEPDAGIIKADIKSSSGYTGALTFNLYIDANVTNEDANYGQKFWEEVTREVSAEHGVIISKTLKTEFYVAAGMRYSLLKNGEKIGFESSCSDRKGYVSNRFTQAIEPGDKLTLIKYVSVLSSLNIKKDNLLPEVNKRILQISLKGYNDMFSSHLKEWERIWNSSDIVINGDIASQQAIRFNIFHLNQTYTGRDERLNIGPKGFTGEKYGGSTYWDTEAFALPFFLKTANQDVSRNLLLYRFRHLEKSILNASKLGFKGGAALYPMVTMNGEECHNEWEITFEEIHRNGAMAYAIYNYVRHTGDNDYMADYGLEVLIGISRFWRQRISWSEYRKKYVILGVTGPNEYENNVNNNWFTNTLAQWTLSYTISNLLITQKEAPGKFSRIMEKTNFNYVEETGLWSEIIENIYFPFDADRQVFLQQDGFLDKELLTAVNIPAEERPINQHWSWDRILRSCFIKQADVLQGIYIFENRYDTETIRRNFDFYEPMTVHESSLSASIHSIIASRVRNMDKAYELFLRTARLDLDDYNNEVKDGLHITSMAGTCLAVIEGFGGMRIKDDQLKLKPQLPATWKSYSFHARFRGILFEVFVDAHNIMISNNSEKILEVIVWDQECIIPPNKQVTVKADKLNQII
jgi:maltose phosphorylase